MLLEMAFVLIMAPSYRRYAPSMDVLILPLIKLPIFVLIIKGKANVKLLDATFLIGMLAFATNIRE